MIFFNDHMNLHFLFIFISIILLICLYTQHMLFMVSFLTIKMGIQHRVINTYSLLLFYIRAQKNTQLKMHMTPFCLAMVVRIMHTQKWSIQYFTLIYPRRNYFKQWICLRNFLLILSYFLMLLIVN